MRLAIIPLKWALMSLSTSSSFSFSASRSILVRSTYSRNKAPIARESRSRAPFVLWKRGGGSWREMQIRAYIYHGSENWKTSRPIRTVWILSCKHENYLSLMTPALANSSNILSSCSLRRSLLSLRFLFWKKKRVVRGVIVGCRQQLSTFNIQVSSISDFDNSQESKHNWKVLIPRVLET